MQVSALLPRKVGRGGFTLLELMTAIAIIFILAVILLEAGNGWRERADLARCNTNLKSLYVGVTVYMQEQERWPQIDPTLASGNGTEYAKQWFAALSPYGITREGWVCPTVQHSLGDPDLTKPENARVDYVAMPFDDKPRTAYKWSNQPWFVEKANSHSGGNLMIFEDGQIMNLTQAVHRTSL